MALLLLALTYTFTSIPAYAHMAAYSAGMFGMNETASGCIPFAPLYNLPKSGGWWMHAFDGCNRNEPPAGSVLTL